MAETLDKTKIMRLMNASDIKKTGFVFIIQNES